jgi:nucleotide-binding universal stress UspA family protein
VRTPITLVAVGYDGSPEARQALSWAAALCAALDASLRVVHVVGLLEEAHVTPSARCSESDVQMLAGEAGLCPDRVQWRVEEGSAADVLLRLTARPSAVDLLVLGSRGSGKQVATILGSTSLEVAERATVPVVIVPSPAEGDEVSVSERAV